MKERGLLETANLYLKIISDMKIRIIQAQYHIEIEKFTYNRREF